MTSESVALRISKPALLLNRIAQRYSRLSRILMEYVDNSLDSAEVLFDRRTNKYGRPISIRVEINTKPASVTVTDNCTGMDQSVLRRLIQNVGESMKHSQFTNGKFGFGVHAFRAAAKKMRVCSRSQSSKIIHQIVIDRTSDKFSGTKRATETNLSHSTGTEVKIMGFDTAWADGLDATEIVGEIQHHFDRLLGRKNLNISVQDGSGRVIRCKPFNYKDIKGNKVTETINCGELGRVQVNLWVSNVPLPDQNCYFVSTGRRISEISDIKSFMKASIARWAVWHHPNLVGYIEVGEVLDPVITRDEFRRTSTRAKVYKTIIKEVEPVLAQLINRSNKKRRVLEMGKLGSIISRCFNVAVKNSNQRERKGMSYVDQMMHVQMEKQSTSKKRTLEDLEAEEKLALGDDAKMQRGESIEGIAMPAKKKRKVGKHKAEKIKKSGTGKFRMIFVNDLKDGKNAPQRAQLIGDDVYINVQHPDFESRVSYSRKSSKLQITERLCSYLANIAATAYKANMIQRSREGLKKYNDSTFVLFDEILDLEFSIETQLRKYLPAIQREIDGAEEE
jgi:hypothetical protein